MITLIQKQSDFSIHRAGCTDLRKNLGLEGVRKLGEFQNRDEVIDWMHREEVEEFQEPDTAEHRAYMARQVEKNLKACAGL